MFECKSATADMLLEHLRESQHKDMYNWNCEAPEFRPAESREVGGTSSWEPLLNHGISLGEGCGEMKVCADVGKFGVGVSPRNVNPMVPLHHVARWRDCDVKPLMTNNDGHSGSDTNIKGLGDTNIEGMIGIEGVDNTGIKCANKIDVEGGCHEDPDVDTRRVWRGRPRETARFVKADKDQNQAADRKGRIANINF